MLFHKSLGDEEAVGFNEPVPDCGMELRGLYVECGRSL